MCTAAPALRNLERPKASIDREDLVLVRVLRSTPDDLIATANKYFEAVALSIVEVLGFYQQAGGALVEEAV